MAFLVRNSFKSGILIQQPRPKTRGLWQWLNIIFNKVDEKRKSKLGADRTCAEWLLRNGASVKCKGAHEFLSDYNALPGEDRRFHIADVDATDSSIMHYGFAHFDGCKCIERLVFKKCLYLTDEAFGLLGPIGESLRHVEVVDCKNVTGDGILHLAGLSKLENIVVSGLPYLEEKDGVKRTLKRALPNCNVQVS